MYRITTILFLLLILFSCKRNKNNLSGELHNEINFEDISESDIHASSVFRSMDFIKLETNDTSMLADIKRIILLEKMIIISDVLKSSIFFFDRDGNIICRFNRQGKSYGEYISIDDFIIDDLKGQLEILDRVSKKIYIYDIKSFKFLKTIPINLNFIFNFTKKGDYYYFQTNGSINTINKRKTDGEIIAYNNKSGKYFPLLEKKEQLNRNSTQAWEFARIFNENLNGDIYVSLAWHDKIYKLETNQIIPYIKINSGRRGYPSSIYSASYQEKINFLESDNTKNKIHFFKLLMNNNDGVIIAYGLGYPPKVCYFIQNKLNQTLKYSNNIINDFNPFGENRIDIFNGNNGYVISVLYPSQIKSKEQITQIGMSKNDNPAILLFEF